MNDSDTKDPVVACPPPLIPSDVDLRDSGNSTVGKKDSPRSATSVLPQDSPCNRAQALTHRPKRELANRLKRKAN
jgi:hypothetical protein